MKVNHSLIEDILFLELSGDLLGENNGLEIVEIANDYITNRKVQKCAVDLSQVRYMNSNGLGILIALLTKFRNKDGELIIIKPSEQISKLFMITKLNSIFTITDNFESAATVLKNQK
jgi:anti-sigma B factor antagonist